MIQQDEFFGGTFFDTTATEARVAVTRTTRYVVVRVTSSHTTDTPTASAQEIGCLYDPGLWVPPRGADVVLPITTKRALSREAHAALVEQARAVRPTSIATRARFGFQQAARLPCYRGVRAR